MAGKRRPINQPSMAPTTKVSAGGVAGALTVLVVWILGLLHVAVPPEVASALTVIISFVTSYFVKQRVPVAAENPQRKRRLIKQQRDRAALAPIGDMRALGCADRVAVRRTIPAVRRWAPLASQDPSKPCRKRNLAYIRASMLPVGDRSAERTELLIDGRR